MCENSSTGSKHAQYTDHRWAIHWQTRHQQCPGGAAYHWRCQVGLTLANTLPAYLAEDNRPARDWQTCSQQCRGGHIIVITMRQRMVYWATTLKVYVTQKPGPRIAARHILSTCLQGSSLMTVADTNARSHTHRETMRQADTPVLYGTQHHAPKTVKRLRHMIPLPRKNVCQTVSQTITCQWTIVISGWYLLTWCSSYTETPQASKNYLRPVGWFSIRDWILEGESYVVTVVMLPFSVNHRMLTGIRRCWLK